MQCTPLVLLNCEETSHDRLKTFSFCLTMYKPAKMRFPVLCLQVAFWNSLDLCESFHLSITICSTQFCYLQSILRNQKTIISLTIICHFISIILANVSLEAPTKTWKKTDLLSWPVRQVFIYWPIGWWRHTKTLLTLKVGHAFSL